MCCRAKAASFGVILALLASLVCAQDVAPEAATGRTEKAAVHTKRTMVVAAHPLAAQAGYDIIRAGGNAIDAAIATQLVLSLVEPQSSGLGGGGFALVYVAQGKALTAWDGRETAPAAATPERFLGQDGKPLRYRDAVGSGKSVGVPGLVRLLDALHRRHGRLPWPRLFEPALRHAEEGFLVSPRLAQLIAHDPLLGANVAARAYFYRGDGTPRRQGERLRNPEFAAVLRRIASDGADAFYRGDIARDIVEAVRGHPSPATTSGRANMPAFIAGDMREDDLARYRAIERTPLCGTYRGQRICGMPPPSAGGTSVVMLLALLERFPMANLAPLSAQAAHLFAEAGRLAYADRDRYLADPDFVSQPLTELLDGDYLRRRSTLISTTRSMGTAPPGTLKSVPSRAADTTAELPATTHLSIVDDEGNAVSMTSSVESAFGSRIMVRGFLLNNQLTDFAWLPRTAPAPVDRHAGNMSAQRGSGDTANRNEMDRANRGPIDAANRTEVDAANHSEVDAANRKEVDAANRGLVDAANRVEGGKRPRSSMSPTMVFDATGKPTLVIGSPGGHQIINYVARTLVAVLDWKLDIQAAVSLPHYGSRNRETELENGAAAESLGPALRALGHEIRILDMPSGLHGIAITPDGLVGGADPRREGVALGD